MVQHKSAGGLPPAFEIGFAVEGYEMHRTLSSPSSAVFGDIRWDFQAGRFLIVPESL